MGLHSLVAAHMPNRRRSTQASASAEDRYDSGQFILSRPGLLLLGLIATTVGALLPAVGVTPA